MRSALSQKAVKYLFVETARKELLTYTPKGLHETTRLYINNKSWIIQ
jgi:hypothetical protein